MTFQYNILRKLTDAERSLLTDQLAAFGAALNDLYPIPETPEASKVLYGDVTLTLDRTRPLAAERTGNPEDSALISYALWSAVQRNIAPDLRLPMLAIAFNESRLNPQALKRDDIENSYGIWQVNANAWPQYPEEELQTLDQQAAAAQVIYDTQGFGAWFTAARNTGLME